MMTAVLGISGTRVGALVPRLPWLTLSTAGLCAAAYLLAGPAAPALVYDRAGLLSGELYRLLSGHLVHLDARHLCVNLIALVLLGGLYESEAGRLRLAALMGAAAVAISLALFMLSPATLVYCGISGVLDAIFAALAARGWRTTRNPVWLLLGLGALAKIGVEWSFGPIVSPGLAWPPHHGAHLVGLVVGAMVGAHRSADPVESAVAGSGIAGAAVLVRPAGDPT